MDGKASRGGGGAPPARNAAAGRSTSGGKKKAKAKRAATAAVQEPAARVAAGGGKSSNASGGGGNKKSSNAAAAATNAKAEKKSAVVQPVSHQQQQQQQQQSDQSGKKKKKKRRLHAGAVAAKAAAKAAEAAASSRAAAATAAAGTAKDTKQTGDKKSQGGTQPALTKRQKAQKAAQASVAAPKATPAINTRSSSHAAADAVSEKPADSSSLKPAKKKQKLENQQQQQLIAQRVPKKQQQRAAQQTPVSTAAGSKPKPKLKVKRKIDEVNQQLTATTTQPPKKTIRQPPMEDVAAADSVFEENPVAKKPKMVVLNRRTARASSEVPVEAAAASAPELSVLGPTEATPAVELQQDTKSEASSSASATAVAASVAAPVSKAAATEESDVKVGSATPATSQSQELSQTTAADESQRVESASSPVDEAVQTVQSPSPTAQELPTVQDPKICTPETQVMPDSHAVIREEALSIGDEATKGIDLVVSNALQNVQTAILTVPESPTVHHVQSPTPLDVQATPDAPAIREEEAGAVISQQPQSIEVISLTSTDSEHSDSETEDEEMESQEDEEMESYHEVASPSPVGNELLNDWLTNSPGPTNDFEADDLFLQPEPELVSATSGNDETNAQETEMSTPTATSPGNDETETEGTEIPMLPDPVDIAPVVESPGEVATSPVETPESEETTTEVEHQVKVECSVGELHAFPQPEPQEIKSSTMLKSDFPERQRGERPEVKSEEAKQEEPIASSLPAPAVRPPLLPVLVQQLRSTSTAPPQPISTEPSYRAFVRSSFAQPSLRTPSRIEILPAPQSEKKRSWGASFGMGPSTSEQTSSAVSASSSSLPASSLTQFALTTSPLSSWFLSKGHANFVQQVSFPPRPVSDRRRRSLSPRKQLSTASKSRQSHTAQSTQQGLGAQKLLVEEKRYIESVDDDDDQTSSSGNAFLESLALRSNWRTWYGNVDKRDLLDPPLQHVPVDMQQAIESVSQSSGVSAIVDANASGESQERTKSSSRSIELLEAEIRAEKARARAFDQELLLMLRGG